MISPRSSAWFQLLVFNCIDHYGEAAREARVQPTTHAELVAYFFNTEFNEMEYEIVKQRPLLTVSRGGRGTGLRAGDG